jgi:hypothetical protein
MELVEFIFELDPADEFTPLVRVLTVPIRSGARSAHRDNPAQRTQIAS